jgi:hypothetical protein
MPVNAEVKCSQGVCGRGPCLPGYFDLDGPRTFGCESTCKNKVCTDGLTTVVVTNEPLPESGAVFQAMSSGAAWGAKAQMSAQYTNIGVLGEPTPPAVGGGVEQTGGPYRNVGGVSAVLR